ncbi:MAG: PAS domain S-box protein [Candidatus Cyclobacteriaceae bacterium M3_2C_046]
METAESNIYLFLSRLLDIQDPAKLIDEFIKGLNQLYPGTNCSWSESPPLNGRKGVEVKVSPKCKGFICLNHSSENDLKQVYSAAEFLEIQLKKLGEYPFGTVNPNSQNLYYKLFDEGTDACYLLNQEGHVVKANQAAAKMLGYDRDELLNVSIEKIDSHFTQKLFKEFWQQNQGNDEFILESNHLHKSGAKIPVEICTKRFYPNKEIFYLSNVRNISARKLNDKKLKESQEQFKFIAENTSDVIIMHEPGKKFLYISPAIYQLTGYTPEEYYQFSSFQNVHPEDHQKLKNNVKKIFDHDHHIISRYRIKNKAGQWIWIETRTKTIKNGPHEPLLLVTLAHDITEQIKTEAKVKETNQKYRFLAESSSELVALHEPDGVYQYLSPSVKELLGFEAEELIGANPYDYFHPDDQERIRKESHQLALEGNAIKGVEYRIRKKDGNYIWFDTYTDLILDEDGSIKYLITRSRDVSDKILSKQALAESEEKFRLLFENMNVAFSLHEIITDDENQPINYRFLEVNSMFTKLTGLKEKDVVGKTVLEVMPDTEPYWIKTFGDVAITGKTIVYINYSSIICKYYDTKTY